MATVKYIIGQEYNTPQGRIKVLDIMKPIQGIAGRSNKRGVIMFVESGWVANVQLSNIPQGKIKDKRKPTVYGVGYLDTNLTIPQRGSDSYIRKVYDLWCNMLKRCYTPHADFLYYKDVVVDKRWHSFRHFLGTIHLVRGYNEWVKDSSMHLDKDLNNSRIYDINSCVFMDRFSNAYLASMKRWHGK